MSKSCEIDSELFAGSHFNLLKFSTRPLCCTHIPWKLSFQLSATLHYLHRGERHVDAGSDESWVVGQQLDHLRRRRTLRRCLVPTGLQQSFSGKKIAFRASNRKDQITIKPIEQLPKILEIWAINWVRGCVNAACGASNHELNLNPDLTAYSQLVLDPRRDGEGVSRLDVLEDLVVAEALEGEAAEGDHLVEEDAVRPHVRHRREEAVRQALRRHPTHREHS